MTWTVTAVLQWTTEHFKKNRIPTPRLDAELLMAHVLKTDRVGVYTRYDRPLDSEERRMFRERINRRLKHEPIAYITGHREFFSLDFLVCPGVLIPRPDTEVLVEKALEMRKSFGEQKIYVLDIGTGSGNIAVSLASRMSSDKITACDLSGQAISIAKENARRLKTNSIEFLQGNLFAPVRGKQFDMIVSNPPYIDRGEYKTLEADIRNFEPKMALDGGYDGLDFYRRIIGESKIHLKKDGIILLEIGAFQADAVINIFAASASVNYCQTQKDYAGHNRVIVGQKV